MTISYHALSRAVSLVAAFGVAHTAYAADTTENSTSNTLTLPKTVVTATRLQTPLRDVVGDVTVITEDELKTHQGQTVLEVLQGQPSIQIRQTGTIGTTASVYMRGNRSPSTLVLIDGIRYSSVSTGSAALNLIPADLVQRIEILYGSTATSLYGADAVGGVIQVFTQQGGYNSKNAQLSVSSGSQKTRVANTSLHYGTDKIKATFGAGYSSTDGISVSKPTASKYVYESDDDGYKSKNASLNITGKLLANTQLSVNGLFSESDTQIDSGRADHQSVAEQRNGAASISLTTKPIKQVQLALSHGYSLDNSKTKASFSSDLKTTQQQSKILGTASLPQAGDITVGAELLKQKLTTPRKYAVKARDITSFILGYQLSKDMFDVQASARRDKNSQFGTVNTYSFGATIEPITGLRFGSSYATGFRSPSFNELYYPGGGNPALKAEKSKNLEVFTSFDTANHSSRVTYHHNKVTNKIDGWPATNIANATIKGIGFKSKWQLAATSLGLHYDLTDAKDKATGKQLSYVAKHTGGAFLGYTQPNWSMRTELNFVGDRYTRGKRPQKLGAYTLANLYTSYSVTPYMDVNLRVNNLFDEDYESAENYNTLGRNALVGVTLRTK